MIFQKVEALSDEVKAPLPCGTEFFVHGTVPIDIASAADFRRLYALYRKFAYYQESEIIWG
jgi:hypothetical protein